LSRSRSICTSLLKSSSRSRTGITSACQDNPFFDLHFKKVYSLEAYSCASKYAFARTVNKLNHAYLKKDLQIVNFDSTY
ncbi:unnamed protein product, partial [Gulo gulo]